MLPLAQWPTIFRHHFAIQFPSPAYGHALRHPDYHGDLYPSMEVGGVGYICEVCELRKCNRRRQPARVDIEGKLHRVFNLY
jgi:hypothetical protein